VTAPAGADGDTTMRDALVTMHGEQVALMWAADFAEWYDLRDACVACLDRLDAALWARYGLTLPRSGD
jgi:hypothetical protein